MSDQVRRERLNALNRQLSLLWDEERRLLRLLSDEWTLPGDRRRHQRRLEEIRATIPELVIERNAVRAGATIGGPAN